MATTPARSRLQSWSKLWEWRRPSSRPRTPVHEPEIRATSSRVTPRWSLGVMNDKHTDLVPGSVQLMLKPKKISNEPLDTLNDCERGSISRPPSAHSPGSRTLSPVNSTSSQVSCEKPPAKTTADGQIILEPQPDDSVNDPLNWSAWRRDLALASLGYMCMFGGGMTAIIAAGFNKIAQDYAVTVPQVSLTTGIYMMGMGLGSVIFAPTAILWGKRPVYLLGGILFVLSAVWCALSPSYASLVTARVFQGIAVSPVECLPSDTIADIYFLHERAFRLGVYTLLLLGGKNLIPLIGAVIINYLNWRWVFWIIAMLVGLGTVLIFLFLPETFWDRTLVRYKSKSHSRPRSTTGSCGPVQHSIEPHFDSVLPELHSNNEKAEILTTDTHHASKTQRIDDSSTVTLEPANRNNLEHIDTTRHPSESLRLHGNARLRENFSGTGPVKELPSPQEESKRLDNTNLASIGSADKNATQEKALASNISQFYTAPDDEQLPESYTYRLKNRAALNYWQTLRPWNGRLRQESWIKCMARPFVLYAYPPILWSSLIYASSVGWLIVLSESLTTVFSSGKYGYKFGPLQAGLIYVAPFVGGIFGTVVAGFVSDKMVRAMARRNGGMYEPEFRLVMGIPILMTTVAGLMGFGLSAHEHDAWIVPTVFFGILSFGCTLGSTTAITYAVDSYRAYASEALVTLNFSKNVLHGLVFSLFVTHWLERAGSRQVYLVLGGVQIAIVLTTIPTYIYGKRLRLWTARKRMMDRLSNN